MAGKFEKKGKPSAGKVLIELFFVLTVFLAILGGIFAVLVVEDLYNSEKSEKREAYSQPEMTTPPTEVTEATEINEIEEKFKHAERLFINQQYEEAAPLLKELGTYKHANVLLSTCKDRIKEVAKEAVLENIKNWADNTEFDWPNDQYYSAVYYNSTPYRFDIVFTMHYTECNITEQFSAKNIMPQDRLEVKFQFPSNKIEGKFHYTISWDISNVTLVNKAVTSTAPDKTSPTTENKSTPINKKPVKNFTNEYGTATTICAHPGCFNYIASSGDTNCCTTHSSKCMDCNKYIDEDGYWCVSCLAKAVSPTCIECGKGAGYSIKGISGQTEYYCQSCYNEILGLLEWLENN